MGKVCEAPALAYMRSPRVAIERMNDQSTSKTTMKKGTYVLELLIMLLVVAHGAEI